VGITATYPVEFSQVVSLGMTRRDVELPKLARLARVLVDQRRVDVLSGQRQRPLRDQGGSSLLPFAAGLPLDLLAFVASRTVGSAVAGVGTVAADEVVAAT
jgi:hypothetical protein